MEVLQALLVQFTEIHTKMEVKVVLTIDDSQISEHDMKKELKKLKSKLEDQYDATIYNIEFISDYE